MKLINRLWKIIIIPFLCTAAEPGLELISDGKPCAEIVVDENADEQIRLAAQDLQYYLAKMSGAELPIVTAGQSKGERLVCIGESACTRRASWYKPASFKTSGCEIRVHENMVILAGAELHEKAPVLHFAEEMHPLAKMQTLASTSGQNEYDCGASHAVTEFLERLGVRFYAPYEDGTIIPRKKTVTVPYMNQVSEADFARRVFNVDYPLEQDPEGRRWLRRLKCGSYVEPTAVLPLAAVFGKMDKMPDEWLAKDNMGRAMLTSDGLPFPRLAQASFQQACIKLIRQTLDAHPGLKRLELALPVLRDKSDYNDYMGFLTKKVFPQPVPSDIMVSFFAAVAREIGKTHPYCLLVCQTVPDNKLPSPNILQNLPQNLLIQPVACSAVLYSAPKTRDKCLSSLDGLAKLASGKCLQQVEWWNEPSIPDAPRQGFWFMHGLQKARRAQKPLICGVRMLLGGEPNAARIAEVPMTHLMYYVNSKLLWNAELDLNALLDEYCDLWFGPASSQMKSFFKVAENIAGRDRKRSISPYEGQLLKEDLAICFELLSKAKAQTLPNTLFRRRIEELENSLAPMKQVFARFKPGNVDITGTILHDKTVCDGDLGKYRHWYKIPGEDEATHTEYALAVTDHRRRMLVAFRCFDSNADSSQPTRRDDPALFKGPYVSFAFSNAYRNSYAIAVNPSGSFCDSSSDPEELALNGNCLGWNPQTIAKTRRLPDHWEAEIEFSLSGCGKLPDMFDAWKVQVSRTRIIDGRQIRTELEDARFTLPVSNSMNEPVYDGYNWLRKVPGTPDECSYTIHRARQSVELSAPWDSPCWKDIPVMQMGWELIFESSSNAFLPMPQVKIQHDGQFLYVLYQVKDKYVRGIFQNDQDMVCLDSCMEFFVQPVPDGSYYNFECNSAGTLLLYEISQNNGRSVFSQVSLEELKSIQRFSTLPRNLSKEISEPTTWRLGLKIPLELFVRRNGIKLPVSGQVWRGNFYKCADWTSNPRWFLWKKNRTFHAPDGFGTFIFE